MGYASNREPRRQWRAERHRVRAACASCGAPSRMHSAELPFCDTCLHGAPRSDFTDRDELDAD